jgi:hypothetical protein
MILVPELVSSSCNYFELRETRFSLGTSLTKLIGYLEDSTTTRMV